jgi:transposase
MYIRQTSIKSKNSDENYFTYRLVESHRVDGKVKQRTLLNLGRHFSIERNQWSLLTSRVEELLSPQQTLVSFDLPTSLESEAQYIVNKLQERGYGKVVLPQNMQTIDIDTLELHRPRKIGIEQLALHAINQVNLVKCLLEIGFNKNQLAAAIGNIVGRMAFPASENATYKWLYQRSGLGELIGFDFEKMGIDRLYQASDLLWKHKETIEKHLYKEEQSLFSLEETVTLYDLTNTFFEGTLTDVEKAQRGRSKEKRSDCPLVTLALVLDNSGFPKRSKHFAGNVGEASTLKEILEELNVSKNSTIVMDAGISTEDNIIWLNKMGYYYIVVSRKRDRQFNPENAVIVKEEKEQLVKAERVVDENTGEVMLYCHSKIRELKEQAILTKAKERFEEAITSLHNGLKKKRTTKKIQYIQQRIGRLKEKHNKIAQHYIIDIEEKDGKAIAISWKEKKKENSQATHPGVYCLRSNHKDWDESKLWKTFTMLTNLEAVFRSLKGELGMRPVYHHKEMRIDGHIFITVLAYHLVHIIRTQLKLKGINDNWESIRCKMENRLRVTVKANREDGKTLHIRKTTKAEPHQKEVLTALKLSEQTATSIMLV